MSQGNSLLFQKLPFGKTYCCDLRPENVHLKMWGRDSDISIVPVAQNYGTEY